MSPKFLAFFAALACFAAVSRAYPADVEENQVQSFEQDVEESAPESGDEPREEDAPPQEEPEGEEEPAQSETPGEALQKIGTIIKDGYEGLKGTISEVGQLGQKLKDLLTTGNVEETHVV